MRTRSFTVGIVTIGLSTGGLCQQLPELGHVASIAVGGVHACVVTTSGQAQCWGSNQFGKLGMPSPDHQSLPTAVLHLPTGVASIAAGGEHSCAVTTAGGVKCWGFGAFGQLGGPLGDSGSADVTGLSSGVRVVSTGEHHSCALTNAGGIKCWGRNAIGQLGDETTEDRAEPANVKGLASGVVAISAGYQHTCAITEAGGVKCWGHNGFGQLGDGSQTSRNEPVDVIGLSTGVKSISAGTYHTCASLIDGKLLCWGNNLDGQLGDGSRIPRFEPTMVPGLPNVAAVSAGYLHTCAIADSGAASCWGVNEQGQVGDGTPTRRLTPVFLAHLGTSVKHIAVGVEHTCAVTKAGAVSCWGGNGYGQLGQGFFSPEIMPPVDVPGLSQITDISAGANFACALDSGGAVKCWGDNSEGTVGDGSTTSRHFPVGVAGLGAGVSQIDVGLFHACAITGDKLECWGYNADGRLGNGTGFTALTPTEASIAGVPSTGLGGHSCAVTDLGGAKCWGANNFGQLGDGTKVVRFEPTQVTSLTSNIVQVTAGITHSCALTGNGAVKCWGANAVGQLGNGTNMDSATPVDVLGLGNGVVAVASGGFHTCALTVGGGVKCWGENLIGQAGDRTTVNRSIPTDVYGLSAGVVAISARYNHTCALLAGGALKCWGWNAFGQVGDGVQSNLNIRTEPSQVVGLTAGVAQVAAGAQHTCARMSAGGVKCWGWTRSGALGEGSFGGLAVPTPVRATAAAWPLRIEFGTQSMFTTSPGQRVSIANSSNTDIPVLSVTASANFTATNSCTTVASGQTCTIEVTFRPTVEGFVPGTLGITTSAKSFTVSLTGAGERALTTHYYRSILGREPDAGGKNYWENAAVWLSQQGADPREVWYALASTFYSSPEYAARNRTDGGFVTDLYRTFFNRDPDQGGFDFWTSRLRNGMPREVVSANFMFSLEFQAFAAQIFGTWAARAETSMVIDFYRGLLGRLPDPVGFQYWISKFREAQCSIDPTSNVMNQADQISLLFATSSEYMQRDRTTSQYVGDLYSAFLRRGGDLGGVLFWIGSIDRNEISRGQARAAFVNSNEFKARVAAVTNEVCQITPPG